MVEDLATSELDCAILTEPPKVTVTSTRKGTFQNALQSLLREIQIDGMREIYLVGSTATNEQTIFVNEANEASSDIDIILDLSILSYTKFRLLNSGKQLSEMLTARMLAIGFKTHVSIGVTCLSLSKFMPSVAPNSVFIAEFIPFSSWNSGKEPKQLKIPSKFEAFDLTISAVADYVFLKSEKKAVTRGDCYVLAKRCLTLLNSVLIFKGMLSKGYKSRLSLARLHSRELVAIINAEEMRVLSVLTEFKLSGNFDALIRKLPIPTHDFASLFFFLEDFFSTLALKTLIYELRSMLNDDAKSSGKPSVSELDQLSKKYFKFKQKSLFSVIFSVLRLSLFLFEPNKTRLKIALKTLLSQKVTIDIAMQYLIMTSFLSLNATLNEPNQAIRLSQTKSLWNLFKN